MQRSKRFDHRKRNARLILRKEWFRQRWRRIDAINLLHQEKRAPENLAVVTQRHGLGMRHVRTIQRIQNSKLAAHSFVCTFNGNERGSAKHPTRATTVNGKHRVRSTRHERRHCYRLADFKAKIIKPNAKALNIDKFLAHEPPPSRLIRAPVMYDEASDANNSAVPTISSGCPI